ncbi:MAG: alkaline phosphatase D family protein [Micromonosporaceae bacterium]
MTDVTASPQLLLGPVLRWVDAARATIWLQIDRPCVVEVRAGPARSQGATFTAYGRHYALVTVTGLPEGAATPYQVRLDGQPVWPPPGSPFPPSVIRTLNHDAPLRLGFGSCRHSTQRAIDLGYPPDALDTYAIALAAGEMPFPDYLIMLGDQVYADETSPGTRRFLRRRRRRRRQQSHRPATQVTDFAEYTQLYLESWSDPELRWLLSTVPSMMIFDDHEVIDDWNTSAAWRRMIREQPWWQERITGALASYWVYQHLGNLSPDELAHDPLFKAVHDADDAAVVLREFARSADAEADGASGPRWSYRIDLGRTRVLMLDTRCSRVLDESHRDMLPEAEWRWLLEQLPGDYDHLVIGSSLPWLLPPAIHEVEGWNETLCRSPRRRVAAASEWLRQAVDLEHWAAFRGSFDRLGDLLADVAQGRFGARPATVTVLSGDVHHTYLAKADWSRRPGGAALAAAAAPIHQITCSPLHHQAPHALRMGFHIGWTRGAELIGRALARLAGNTRASMRWHKVAGPYFQNALGLLTHQGRSAHLALHGVRRPAPGSTELTTLERNQLS